MKAVLSTDRLESSSATERCGVTNNHPQDAELRQAQPSVQSQTQTPTPTPTPKHEADVPT